VWASVYFSPGHREGPSRKSWPATRRSNSVVARGVGDSELGTMSGKLVSGDIALKRKKRSRARFLAHPVGFSFACQGGRDRTKFICRAANDVHENLILISHTYSAKCFAQASLPTYRTSMVLVSYLATAQRCPRRNIFVPEHASVAGAPKFPPASILSAEATEGSTGVLRTPFVRFQTAGGPSPQLGKGQSHETGELVGQRADATDHQVNVGVPAVAYKCA
jgi:hypothetical protein